VRRLPREQKRESNRVLNPKRGVAVFTDGSASHKDGSGGWAFVAIDCFGNEEIGSGGVLDTTVGRMEMQAWIEGLNHMFKTLGSCELLMYSDSQYVVLGTSDRTRKRRVNKDLWFELDSAIDQHEYVESIWVKGHHESYYNHLVDELAGNARKQGLETS